MRIGHGFDVHQLVEGRPCIIGGVTIPFEKGLLGHSDADVLLHSVADACLGAIGEGDIGKHFPDTDEAFKDAYQEDGGVDLLDGDSDLFEEVYDEVDDEIAEIEEMEEESRLMDDDEIEKILGKSKKDPDDVPF